MTTSTPIGSDLNLLCEAVAVVAKSRQGRISFPNFQRKMRVGFVKAGRLVELLADHDVIGGYENGYMTVLISPDDVERVVARLREQEAAR